MEEMCAFPYGVSLCIFNSAISYKEILNQLKLLRDG